MSHIENQQFKTGSEFSLFGVTAGAWLLLGGVLSLSLSVNSDQSAWAFKSFLGLWVLSALDLAILAKFLFTVGHLMNSEGSARSAYAVQTGIWGLCKVVCLGLFVLVLLKGHEIPMHSILLGMGTLVVVPLAGGFIWSQRVLRNA